MSAFAKIRIANFLNKLFILSVILLVISIYSCSANESDMADPSRYIASPQLRDNWNSLRGFNKKNTNWNSFRSFKRSPSQWTSLRSFNKRSPSRWSSFRSFNKRAEEETSFEK
ncbi:uncharacterized protein LOC134848035 [Symsagittifera roscoffensis]|uniref:uncharacterized protein LOC134848035 n=1 Tax=Symsagittifera roscoffensis TaxID=84072 RepID=UPI00307BE818